MDADPQLTIITIQDLATNSNDLSLLMSCFVIILLLFCSAMISGSEVAFFSLNASTWENEKNSKSVNQIKKMLKKPNHLLATILISNNLINVGIIILATYITNRIIYFSESPLISFILQIVIIAFALLLFGEVIPKIYANQKLYHSLKK